MVRATGFDPVYSCSIQLSSASTISFRCFGYYPYPPLSERETAWTWISYFNYHWRRCEIGDMWLVAKRYIKMAK